MSALLVSIDLAIREKKIREIKNKANNLDVA